MTDKIATVADVEPMLDDIGEEDPEIRKAMKKFCLDWVDEDKEIMMPYSYTKIEDLNVMACMFARGYEVALKKYKNQDS